MFCCCSVEIEPQFFLLLTLGQSHTAGRGSRQSPKKHVLKSPSKKYKDFDETDVTVLLNAPLLSEVVLISNKLFLARKVGDLAVRH